MVSIYSGTANTKTLEGGKFYKVVVLHDQTTRDSNYVALGVTLPDGTELHPIPNKYLWLYIPGKLYLYTFTIVVSLSTCFLRPILQLLGNPTKLK